MIISSLPMCAVRADGLNFASLEASVQGERMSRNFALTEFSEVRACQTRIAGNAWRYPTLDCEDLLTCHYQNIKLLNSQ